MTASFLMPLLSRAAGLIGLAIMGAAAVFFAMRAAPGDPALTALGDNASTETIAAFRARWNLDDPLPLQFGKWLADALRGDFGQSISIASGADVSALVLSRLPKIGRAHV